MFQFTRAGDTASGLTVTFTITGSAVNGIDYQEIGTTVTFPVVHRLTDRSRRPYRHANQLPLVLEKQIVWLKREYRDWGAPKIREKLRGRFVPLRGPAISTIHPSSTATGSCSNAGAGAIERPGPR